MSCATATSCLAVGMIPAVGSSLGTPLAESWDGSAWTVQSIPGPPGSTGTLMTGRLSCASPVSCVATGFYLTGPVTFHALAEYWNGSTWTIQSTPASPATENSQLNGVSCVSATSCTAVGNHARGVPAEVTGLGALAEYWNGSVWRQVQTTHPSGHNLLYWVLPVPGFCTAAGDQAIWYRRGREDHAAGRARVTASGRAATPTLRRIILHQAGPGGRGRRLS